MHTFPSLPPDIAASGMAAFESGTKEQQDTQSTCLQAGTGCSMSENVAQKEGRKCKRDQEIIRRFRAVSAYSVQYR